MTGAPSTGDEAFRRKLAALTKPQLKLRVSAGALIAIVSASHAVAGAIGEQEAGSGWPLLGLAFGLYVAAHYSLLLWAKRGLEPGS